MLSRAASLIAEVTLVSSTPNRIGTHKEDLWSQGSAPHVVQMAEYRRQFGRTVRSERIVIQTARHGKGYLPRAVFHPVKFEAGRTELGIHHPGS